jgi:hypothetical protein
VIYSASTIQAGGPTRLLVLPRNGPIFGYWKCFIQVTGPNTIFLSSSRIEGQNQIGATQDGLQFNNVNASEPYEFLWRGELWASASANGTLFVIVVPGQEHDNLPCPTEDAQSDAYSEV